VKGHIGTVSCGRSPTFLHAIVDNVWLLITCEASLLWLAAAMAATLARGRVVGRDVAPPWTSPRKTGAPGSHAWRASIIWPWPTCLPLVLRIHCMDPTNKSTHHVWTSCQKISTGYPLVQQLELWNDPISVWQEDHTRGDVEHLSTRISSKDNSCNLKAAPAGLRSFSTVCSPSTQKH
jgi:hypothetical protein